MLRTYAHWDDKDSYVTRMKKILVPDLSKKKYKKKKNKGKELLLKTPVKMIEDNQ